MVSYKKKTQIASLTELLQKNPNLILVNFDKTPHRSLERLRKDLKKNGASFKVIKNTLFGKAVNKIMTLNPLFAEFKKKFLPAKNSSALLTFSSDWSRGLHTFYDFIQKEKTLDFKSGILDGQLYGSGEILRIAKLPNKNQLLANIIGSLKNPMYRLTYSLRFNTNKFVFILKQKGGDPHARNETF